MEMGFWRIQNLVVAFWLVTGSISTFSPEMPEEEKQLHVMVRWDRVHGVKVPRSCVRCLEILKKNQRHQVVVVGNSERTQLDFGGKAQLVDHADLEGLVVVAAQHVLDGGDVDGRVLLRALLPPRTWEEERDSANTTQPERR